MLMTTTAMKYLINLAVSFVKRKKGKTAVTVRVRMSLFAFAHVCEYCSRDYQKAHWREHKVTCCERMPLEQADRLAKELVEGLRAYLEDSSIETVSTVSQLLKTLETVSNDDVAFDLAASKYGIYPIVEGLFHQEANRRNFGDDRTVSVSSWTQHLTSTIFRGDRNNPRFHCVCPHRSKAFIL